MAWVAPVTAVLLAACASLLGIEPMERGSGGGAASAGAGAGAGGTGTGGVGGHGGSIAGAGGVGGGAGSGGSGACAAGGQSPWMQQVTPTGDQLMAIHFIDPNTGWAVGDDCTIIYTTDGGCSWIPQDGGPYCPGDILNDVFFIDGSNGWVVGQSGRMMATFNGGLSWQSPTTYFMADKSLQQIHFVDAQTGWCLELHGVYRTNNGGVTWFPQLELAPTDPYLNDLFFITSQYIWLVGAEETMRYSTDGGHTWIIVDIASGPVFDELSAIHFVNENTGWVVGSGAFVSSTINGGYFPTDWESHSLGVTQDTLRDVFSSPPIPVGSLVTTAP